VVGKASGKCRYSVGKAAEVWKTEQIAVGLEVAKFDLKLERCTDWTRFLN